MSWKLGIRPFCSKLAGQPPHAPLGESRQFFAASRLFHLAGFVLP